MGLTIQSDIPILYEKVKELKESLLDQITELKNNIDELNVIIFESNVLLQKDESWDVIRKKRDYLLKSTDWTLTPGATVDQSAWAAYRQVLRDLPQTYAKGNAKDVVWPKTPTIKGPNSAKKKGPVQ